MRTITYDQLLEAASKGNRVKIVFPTRKVQINNKNVQFVAENEEKIEIEEVLNEIERLYEIYKFSVPSEKSESTRRKYFKALPYDCLSNSHLIDSEDRNFARIQLEAYVLMAIMCGWLYWDEEKLGKWYWQSKIDRDLIILKEWIG